MKTLVSFTIDVEVKKKFDEYARINSINRSALIEKLMKQTSEFEDKIIEDKTEEQKAREKEKEEIKREMVKFWQYMAANKLIKTGDSISLNAPI